MNAPKKENRLFIGILLAIFACLMWSGNFIVARGISSEMPAITLAFYRWLAASFFILILGYRHLVADWQVILRNYKFILLTAFTGIALYNTCIYTAGHYTTAIHLVLVGSTSSPVMSIIMAHFLLKERLTVLRIAGVVICIGGILLLLSGGSLDQLRSLSFSPGDTWMLAGAFFFAVYNIQVRKKPPGFSPLGFLCAVFVTGMLMLLPFFLYEHYHTKPVEWNMHLGFTIFYLGLGASVISYLCWNAAIGRLGAGRTALFGNLIPVFSSIEAAILLNEQVTYIHVISLAIVIGGLAIANLKKRNAEQS